MEVETLTSMGFVSPDRFRCANTGGGLFFLHIEGNLNGFKPLQSKWFPQSFNIFKISIYFEHNEKYKKKYEVCDYEGTGF